MRQRQRRLAAAALADDSDDPAAADIERDVAQHMHLAARRREGDVEPADPIAAALTARPSASGSIASRSASPKSVKPSVASVSASPAKTAVQTDWSR